ncbi:MAG TPA: DNA mismatch repair endonuclease MutL [Pyrinomonadaceae bacterium]|jgi:DNA mismatch repair protein MutL|nr:DNA mismatch repair endonuclease MutL [Pyrinomonadaceae bacterium]
MPKIHVLSDQLANQIAAGEVVERPASVAKELVENAIDAGARRIHVDSEAGGRRLLRVMDDGSGMTRDDALLAFERHATSKISRAEDLFAIGTLGFRGEALASIASVARVELVTKTEEDEAATRVLIEGGRMRDVKAAAHPRGTTISVRELFFNVPARRKFLRSEATESFHLMNLVTHYALAHPETAFTLTNNGRETLRAAPAVDLRERAYQIFGADFVANLLEVGGGHGTVARVRGFISAPRERRTSRDAQYLFINGRYVRDPLIGRALSEGYRAILPQGVYPAALLFLEVPLEEVDVNVHPAKTEVRFRRAAAVADAVREAVRATLASAGYVRASDALKQKEAAAYDSAAAPDSGADVDSVPGEDVLESGSVTARAPLSETKGQPSTTPAREEYQRPTLKLSSSPSPPQQGKIEFSNTNGRDEAPPAPGSLDEIPVRGQGGAGSSADAADAATTSAPLAHLAADESEQTFGEAGASRPAPGEPRTVESALLPEAAQRQSERSPGALPPLTSLAGLVREIPAEALSANIRPLGQLGDSFIIATDDEGLLLIDQHTAHERILFDKYHRREAARSVESQNLLMPETFDLTPAQAALFETVAGELESYGFGLMRLSGRTVAIKAVPADLPASEARNMLAEILETVDAEKRGAARTSLGERIAITLASRAAIKSSTPLAPEKLRWLIDRLLVTSSPTTCPHGHPIILRLATRDIVKGFQRS